jgi:hypothetical protein
MGLSAGGDAMRDDFGPAMLGRIAPADKTGAQSQANIRNRMTPGAA